MLGSGVCLYVLKLRTGQHPVQGALVLRILTYAANSRVVPETMLVFSRKLSTRRNKMRKHCKQMAARWGRNPGDRSNAPQSIGHQLANSKPFQLAANSLLSGLIKRAIA